MFFKDLKSVGLNQIITSLRKYLEGKTRERVNVRVLYSLVCKSVCISECVCVCVRECAFESVCALHENQMTSCTFFIGKSTRALIFNGLFKSLSNRGKVLRKVIFT